MVGRIPVYELGVPAFTGNKSVRNELPVRARRHPVAVNFWIWPETDVILEVSLKVAGRLGHQWRPRSIGPEHRQADRQNRHNSQTPPLL